MARRNVIQHIFATASIDNEHPLDGLPLHFCKSPGVSHFALVWSFSPLSLHDFHSLEIVVAFVCLNLSSVIFRLSVGFRSGSGIAVSLFQFQPILQSDKQQHVGEAASDKDYAETPHTVILPNAMFKNKEKQKKTKQGKTGWSEK